MYVYLQFPGNKFSNAFQRNKKKKVKAHCLKLNPSSALKTFLPLLLYPVESINFLKLHKSQHWDMVPSATSKWFLAPHCVACLSSASLSSTKFLLQFLIC